MNPLALGSGDVDPTRRVVARRRRMRVEASALLRGASVVARAWTRGGGGGWRARGMGTRASARAALDVYSLLQSPTCCRHIGFVALEAFIVSLFPEVIAHAASKDLERALEA